MASLKKLEKMFKAMMEDPENFMISEEYNGFTHPATPIISNKEPGMIVNAQWGLVPFFAKDNAKEFWKKSNTLNAKIETVDTKNSFKHSLDNRCLVLATSFFEWKHVGKEKIKHRIFTKDNEPFAFAGLFNENTDSSGNTNLTYTILTTDANELMTEIHNSKKRMPVVLRKQEEELWLKGEPMEIYHNRSEVELIAEPVDKMPLQLF